jgi:hypothetical protein
MSELDKTNWWLRMARFNRLNFRVSRLYSASRSALYLSVHHIFPGTLAQIELRNQHSNQWLVVEWIWATVQRLQDIRLTTLGGDNGT